MKYGKGVGGVGENRNLRDHEKDLPLGDFLFDDDARDQKGFWVIIANSTNTSHAHQTSSHLILVPSTYRQLHWNVCSPVPQFHLYVPP